MPQEREPQRPPEGPSSDYSYDMAHEVTGSEVSPPHPEDAERHTVHTATQGTDLDQDYSYDLAHDIPRSGGE